MGDWSGPVIYHVVIPLAAAILFPIIVFAFRITCYSRLFLIWVEIVSLTVWLASIGIDWWTTSNRFWLLNLPNSGILLEPMSAFLPCLIFCYAVSALCLNTFRPLQPRAKQLSLESSVPLKNGIIEYQSQNTGAPIPAVISWIALGLAVCSQLMGGLAQVMLPEDYIANSSICFILLLSICFISAFWVILRGAWHVGLVTMALSLAQICAWTIRATMPTISFPLFRL